MALTIGPASIFTSRGADAVTTTRNLGTQTRFLAAQQIDQGAEITVRLATDDAIKRASVATGIETEIIQDQIAKLALNPATYPEYLAYKEQILGKIRAEVLRTFINTVSMYEDIGYTKEQAEKLAAEIAKDVKASQMKIYHALFPHSGQKVKQVY